MIDAVVPEVVSSTVAAGAVTTAAAASSVIPESTPLPGTNIPPSADTSGGSSFYTFMVVGIFGYALYMITKRYF